MSIIERVKQQNEEMLEKREIEIEEVLNGRKVLCTSGTSFEGYEVMEYLGMICEEITVPNGLLGLISHGTFFTVDSISEARRQTIQRLEDRASALGANGIVGIDLDVQVFPSIGAMVSANGTAVRVGLSAQTVSIITQRIEQHMEMERENEDKLMQEITRVLNGDIENCTAEELVRVYRKSGDKKAVIYRLVAANRRPVSAAEIRAQFADEVDLLEIATFLKRLEDEGKVKKDVENKKYSII